MISGKNRISAADLAYFELRNRIANGVIPPGEQVSEDALAELVGLSRTPLRAAVSRLRVEGLIDRASNGRLFVPPVSIKDAEELFAVRFVLEELALETSFAYLDEKMFSLMGGLIEQMTALRGTSGREVGLFGGEFHSVLYKVGGNSLNLALLAQIQGRIDRYRYLSTGTGQERQNQAIEEHRQILDALKKHDLPLAKVVLRAHLEGAASTVKKAIKSSLEGHEEKARA